MQVAIDNANNQDPINLGVLSPEDAARADIPYNPQSVDQGMAQPGEGGDAGRYSVDDIVRATEHLSRPELENFGPNDEMLRRIEKAIKEGLPLTSGQDNFMKHELHEAGLMDDGMEYEVAHEEALKLHPPGRNYDPDVIDQEPLFGPWWRKMNGLGPR